MIDDTVAQPSRAAARLYCRHEGLRCVTAAGICLAVLAIHLSAEPKYDLLLKGGRLIDARNNISAVRDVAIAGGKIAAVASSIDAADALKVVDLSGLYVTPGLVDI